MLALLQVLLATSAKASKKFPWTNCHVLPSPRANTLEQGKETAKTGLKSRILNIILNLLCGGGRLPICFLLIAWWFRSRMTENCHHEEILKLFEGFTQKRVSASLRAIPTNSPARLLDRSANTVMELPRMQPTSFKASLVASQWLTLKWHFRRTQQRQRKRAEGLRKLFTASSQN